MFPKGLLMESWKGGKIRIMKYWNIVLLLVYSLFWFLVSGLYGTHHIHFLDL